MRVLAFMITRANTPQRLALLKETVEQMYETAGHPFDLWIWALTTDALVCINKFAEDTGKRPTVMLPGENVGQHVITNNMIDYADSEGYDYLLRVDDDCKFITKRWLAKMLDASAKLGPQFIISPSVIGLENIPEMTEVVDKDGVPIKVLTKAIGGLCRLHPVDTLCDSDFPYRADIRLPLGFGDATGIVEWMMACAQEGRPRWAVWLDRVRVKHNTTRQRKDDPTYHDNHALFQAIPYIPAWHTGTKTMVIPE